MPEKIGDAILELRTDVKKLVKGLDAAKQKADTAQKKMETRAAKFSKIMKSAAGLGGIAVALAGVTRALKKVFDTVQFAAQVRQTQMAFRSIAEDAGEMANEIVANMQRMSGETINELDIMLAANKASLLGIPVKEFDKLMAIARASATATGGSVQKMFEDIVTGIGRASPMILDNLGITVKIGDANLKYAESLGKTVEQLTAAEKKQALLNEVLISGEDIIRKVGEAGQQLTDVERWQQTAAAAADLRAELGMNLLQTMGEVFEASTDILGAWKETLKTTRLVNAAMAEGALEGNIAELGERWKALKNRIKELTRAQEVGMRTGGRSRKETDAEIEALRTQQVEIAKRLVTMRSELAAKRRAIEVTKELTGATKEQNKEDKKTKDELSLQEWIEKNLVIDNIVAGFQEMTDVQLGLNGLMGGFTDELVATTEAYVFLNEAISASDKTRGNSLIKARKQTEELAEATMRYQVVLETLAEDTMIAFGDSLSEAIAVGADGWDFLAQAGKTAIATILEAFAKQWAVEAIAAYASFNIPKGIGMTAASLAAFAGAGVVRSLATGGDFITQGPQAIMVGDNPGGRERVSVTPVSSPNVNGPEQMIHVTFNLGSRLLYDDIGRATANGEIIIAPRSIRK